MASSSTTKLSMKLLIDTKSQKVLFAEASKPVIDFLFNFLCLPIGTVVKLLSANGMVGSLDNLYQSVENLNQNYMLPGKTKDALLNPRVRNSSTEISGLLTQNDGNDDDDQIPKLYTCPVVYGLGCFKVTHNKTTRCSCGNYMDREVTYVGDDENVAKKNGFVKDDVTFLVMDDLAIQPMSTISSITLLNKLNVKEIDTLQEKVVEIGTDEAIKLFSASMQSKMVLTSVFTNNQKRRHVS